jgi:hypothetical protein
MPHSGHGVRQLRLQALPGHYAVCRQAGGGDVSWARGDLVMIAQSRSEAMPTTVICEEPSVPPDIERDAGWRAIRFAGAFDFREVGVLSSVLSVLATAQVPVLTISTFETDYLLIKAHRFDRVREVLKEAGHMFLDEEDEA